MRQTTMSSYFQLRNHDPDTPDADETVKHPLLHGEGPSADQDGIVSPPNGRSWSDWLTLGLSVLMMATSVALYVDSTKIVAPRSADGLRKPDAYPNLDEVAAFREKRKGKRVACDIATNRSVSSRSPHVVPWSDFAREQSAARRGVRQELACRT